MDEYGLPIRVYDTEESEAANLILKKICIQSISQWFEDYFDLLKDSDCAFEHGISILESLVRYLSNSLYELDQAIHRSSDLIKVDFGIQKH